MYIIDFLKCMDLGLLVKNRKAAQMAFAMIIILLIALVLLIWYLVYTRSLAEKGTQGVNLINKALGGRQI